VAGLCVYGNEPSGPIKGGEFMTGLTPHQNVVVSLKRGSILRQL
jgi:hypothetical protein